MAGTLFHYLHPGDARFNQPCSGVSQRLPQAFVGDGRRILFKSRARHNQFHARQPVIRIMLRPRDRDSVLKVIAAKIK